MVTTMDRLNVTRRKWTYAELGELFQDALVFRCEQNLQRLAALCVRLVRVGVRKVYVQTVRVTVQLETIQLLVFVQACKFNILQIGV